MRTLTAALCLCLLAAALAAPAGQEVEELELESEIETAPELEPMPDLEPRLEMEPEAEVGTAVEVEPRLELDLELGSKVESGLEWEPGSELERDPNLEQQLETESELQAESELAEQSEVQPELEWEAEPQRETERPNQRPELAPLRDVSVKQGDDASLTCIVKHLGDYEVVWIKSDSEEIVAINTRVVSNDERHAVTHNGDDSWQLHVQNAQRSDSGPYTCQVTSQPIRHETGRLEVWVPPRIVYSGHSLLTVPEGGAVFLHCKGSGHPKPTIMWTRPGYKNIVLRRRNGFEVRSQLEDERLFLSGVRREDMGYYLCVAVNDVPPPVAKRFRVIVLFNPGVNVTTQVVKTKQGCNAVLLCYVESYPRAVHTWHRDAGRRLCSDPVGKYRITERQLSEYAVLMNLTIVNVRHADFGSYTCRARNYLGQDEGGVELQEL